MSAGAKLAKKARKPPRAGHVDLFRADNYQAAMARSRTLKPGDLVIDSYGAKCILLSVYEQIPNDKWLARQQDPRGKKHKNGTWWKTITVAGGGGVVAEALVNYVSRTSREDFDEACAKGLPRPAS